MTEEQIIDKILSDNCDSAYISSPRAKIEKHADERKFVDIILRRMYYEELIEDINNPDGSVTVITPKGREIVRNGGYLKHLEELKRIEERKEKQANLNLKFTRFQVHTYWIWFALSIIGVGLSIWALIK